MTTLQQALEASAWQFILAVGRQRGLSLDSNLSKSDLIAKIVPTLLDPTNLAQALARLPDAAWQALADLRETNGRCPARYLRERYGQLRPAPQLIHRDRRTTTQINLADFAPLEQLCLLGLTFLHRQSDDLFIPADLQERIGREAWVNQPRSVANRRIGESVCRHPKQDEQPSAIPHAPFDLLCHDLTCLLALLQRSDVSPLHGRWLPPNLLKEWGQACAVPPVSPQARSELQTDRRRFIHYLAENAGLVSRQSSVASSQMPRKAVRNPQSPISNLHAKRPISPLPAAWLWLNSSRSERFQALWQAWIQSDSTRWQAYRLPGYTWLTDPARLIAVVNAGLEDWRTGRLGEPSQLPLLPTTLLKRHPHLIDLVPANLLDRAELFTVAVTQLLRGPFVWLGLLSEQGGQILSLAPLPPSPLSLVPAKYNVTPHLTSDPFQSHLVLTPGPGLPDPADLMVALEVGRMKDEGGRKKSFILHPSSFILAIHRGWSPVALIAALNRLAERPLNRQETDLLARWSEAADRMTLHLAALLETSDPGVITRLTATRRGRALIHRTLSPRAVIVDPTRLDQLVQRLTEQEGVPPKVQGSGGVKKQGSRGAGEQGSEEFKSPLPLGSPAYLWLALRVYQALSRHIPLPVRMPQAVLDQLSAATAPLDLAAAETAADQTLAALRQALDGRTPFSAWPEEGLPLAETLPLIQQALAGGQNLRLLYYSPGSDTLTRRLVEPYRLEGWRGEEARRRGGEEMQGSRGAEEQGKDDKLTPAPLPPRFASPAYLVGFCHHAQAERMFRLDRIREIELVAREV